MKTYSGNRNSVEHLRDEHGFNTNDDRLYSWSAETRKAIHDQDHDDYHGGTPVDGKAHKHEV